MHHIELLTVFYICFSLQKTPPKNKNNKLKNKKTPQQLLLQKMHNIYKVVDFDT